MNTTTEITDAQPARKCSTCGQPFPENSCGICPNCFDVGDFQPSGMPELEPIPDVRDIEVWARLKKSSKYYNQGLVGCSDPNVSNEELKKAKARFFKLDHFTPLPALRPEMGTSLSRDSYVLHFNDNHYRIEDCEIFLRSASNAKHFVRLL